MTDTLDDTPSPARHTLWDDAQGLLTGCLFCALGLLMFREASLVTGGTAGLAFLIHYVQHWPLSVVLFVINLPFALFAFVVMGRVFTLKTFLAIGLLSLYVAFLPKVIAFQHLDPVFAAVMGGLLAGTGILILIRHGSNLSGLNIMAIYLQRKKGWRAGTVQMVADAAILLSALLVVSYDKVLLSLLGAIAVNLVIGVNHRTDRYFGM